MIPELIHHRRLLFQGRLMRAALAESYGLEEPAMHAREFESLAVDLSGTTSWPTIRRMMYRLRSWYRQFVVADTPPCLARGQRVLWQLNTWHNPLVTITKTVTVVCQVGDVVWVKVRDRDGYVVRKLDRGALKVRGSDDTDN